MRAMTTIGLISISAILLAGCVAEVKQTEPLRIQIDGEGQNSRICADPCDNAGSGEATSKSEFQIEAQDDVEELVVVVDVEKIQAQSDDGGDDGGNMSTPTTSGNATTEDEECVVLVTVQDKSTGETLAQEEIRTVEETSQAEINVNIKGNNNIVVITEAVAGTANVNVAARGSSAGGSLEEGGDETGATATSTSTNSPSPTTSTPY